MSVLSVGYPLSQDGIVAIGQNALVSGGHNVALGAGASIAVGTPVTYTPCIKIGHDQPHDVIRLGNIDVLDLVDRLKALEKTVCQQDAELARLKCNPVFVDFDEIAMAMTATASDEPVFVNPPETGSTIELKYKR